MIPANNISGVLPPFVGGNPTIDGMSPYATTMTEIARRFCINEERVKLFRGLVSLRADLQSLGFTKGVQWIDGSFCEDVEAIRGRPPGDIDLVTLLIRPPHLVDPSAWTAFVGANTRIFDKVETKKAYGCEAFYVDVGFPAFAVERQITYWFGLFSHQRVTHLWKGMLLVQLVGDDTAALAYVDGLQFPP